MNNFLRNAIAFGIIVISLSVGYYFIIFMPKNKNMELEIKKQESEKKIEMEQNKQDSENSKTEQEKKDRQNCYDWAEQRAVETTKYRYEDLGYKQYKKLSEEGGYLRDDFDKFYEDCLSSKGFKK